eukprot:gene29713-5146_t
MSVTLDAAALQAELEELRKEREEAKQRLDTFKSRRGFGAGPPGLPGPPIQAGGRGLGRDGARNGIDRSTDHRGGREGPGSYRDNGRDSGRDAPGRPPFRPSDRPDGRLDLREQLRGGRGDWDRSRGPRGGLPAPPSRDGPRAGHRGRSEQEPERWGTADVAMGEKESEGDGERVEAGEVAAQPTRKRISSAVVAVSSDNISRDAEGNDKSGQAGSAKRPLESPAAEDPSAKKRNRRMFGALMGTLQRFKVEDDRFSSSVMSKRRVEQQKKAEDRAKEESEQLRRQEREEKEKLVSELMVVMAVSDLIVVMVVRAEDRAKDESEQLCRQEREEKEKLVS